MDLNLFYLGLIMSVLFFCINTNATSPEEEEVSSFLEDVNSRLATLWGEETLAKWQNEVNVPEDPAKVEDATKKINDYIRSIATDVNKYKKLPLENQDLKKQLALIPINYAALPEEEADLIVSVITNMSTIYKTVKICSYADPDKCDISFNDQEAITMVSEDIKEIEYYWEEWRRKSREVARDYFKQFAELYRKAAKLNGFEKPSDFWYKDYGASGDFVAENLQKIIQNLKPLFHQLHAYARGQMRSKYGAEVIAYNAPLPHHLSGPFFLNTIFSGDAEQLPFNELEQTDISGKLSEKEVTVQTNFEWINKFYASLGMPELEESFWDEGSKPLADLENIYKTHTAWKFHNLNQVNFTYTPIMNQMNFFYMYEIFANIHYYRSNLNLVTLYQKEPIPETNAVVGKFFALAASAPKYLEGLGLLDAPHSTREERINRLYSKAIPSIFSIHMYYVNERMRLDMLDEKMRIGDNCAYWDLHEDFYGIGPPVARVYPDFDAFALFTRNIDMQFTAEIYYFILQYQLFEYFCALTGEYVKDDPEKPLDLCDLSGHKIVGEKIYKAMSLGTSVSLKEFLKVLMDSEEININGILEYFKPLTEWLADTNKEKNNEIGWERSKKCVP